MSTRYLGMTRKPLSEGLDGDMMHTVDGRMPVPVHMTGKTQKHRAALLDDLTRGGAVMVMPHTGEEALKVKIADHRAVIEWDVRQHYGRASARSEIRGEPGQVGLSNLKPTWIAMHAHVSVPENEMEAAYITTMRLERLSDSRFSVVQGHLADLMVAEQVYTRNRKALEDRGHVLRECHIGFAIHVADTVAKIDNEIGLHALDPVTEVVQQGQGLAATLGANVGAMVNIGDEGEANGVDHMQGSPVPLNIRVGFQM